MAEVEFLHKTALDFVLFKEFAEFIIAQNGRNIRKGYFFLELKEILDIKIEPGTLANKFSQVEQKGIALKLSEKSYKAFCRKFIDTFNTRLTPEKQDDYIEIKTAFDNWKSKLDSKYSVQHDHIQWNESESIKESPTTVSSDQSEDTEQKYPIIYRTKHPDFPYEEGQGNIKRQWLLPTFSPTLKCIVEFYNNIERLEFNRAWDCLSESGKQSYYWRGDYWLFKSWCLGLNLSVLMVWETVEFSDTVVEIKISNTTNEVVLTLPDTLQPLNDLTIIDLDKLKEKIDQFKSGLNKLGIENRKIDEIKLHAIFDKELDSKIFHELKLEETVELDDYGMPFSLIKKNLRGNRCEQCICVKKNGTWFIDNIRDASFANDEYEWIWPSSSKPDPHS